jgi:hypothetical protein
MKAYTLSLLCFVAFHGFGQTIFFEDYFPLKTGDVKSFYVYQITNSDTLKDKNARSVCRSLAVKGTDIYYFTDESRTKNDLVGPNAFCDGVFYYDHGAFRFSPLSWTHEVKEANLAYFDTLFPAQVALNTSYKRQNEEEKRNYTFTRFETIAIAQKVYPDCLKLVVTQDWPTAHYADTVWFQKGTGVVKWLRGTGRLEELKQ